jgi:2-polyprenyl-3-methyl-5-hydroxy-6-metoxy-1,4-benzoquinol methylase
MNQTEILERQRAQGRQPNGAHYKAWERTTQAAIRFPRHVRRIVDVGCGPGKGSWVFKMLFPEAIIVGIECVPEKLQQAVEHQRIDVAHEGFFEDAPLASASIDVVYSGEVIEHIADENADRFIANARRILKPGGLLVLTTPNPRYYRLWLSGRRVTDEPSHLSEWPVGKLKCALHRHGFRVTRVEGTGKVSRYIGTIFPVVPFYGSYMLFALKLSDR